MSATRLLILGVLRFKQPTHGYEIRRELESWRAEEWAHIAYGSIYFALNKLTEEQLIRAVETDQQVNNRPARTTYAITEAGEVEFQRLLREFWWQDKPAIDPLQVAVAFMSDLPTDELLAVLRFRSNTLRAGIEAFQFAVVQHVKEKPRHVAENFLLTIADFEAKLRWMEQAIAKIERNELP